MEWNAHTDSAELYKPLTGEWSITGTIIERRYGQTATLLPDGKVLAIGGYYGSPGVIYFHASTELYDPSIGEWSIAGSMNYGRAHHTATLLPDGKVLVAGGAEYLARLLVQNCIHHPSSSR